MKIKVFSVGGTIDKIYFDELSEYQVGRPGVEEILADLPLSLQYDVEGLMRKDSLEMTNADRDLVVERIQTCSYDKVLLTHGTDTMIETGRRLVSIPDKCIVLTGALQPAGFKASDAVFNIGMAIGILASHKNGVHIAMNGECFDPLACRKDRTLGRFVRESTS